MHARLDAGEAQILTRRGNDWTQKYPVIAKSIAGLPAQNAYLDGELCGVLPDGRTAFNLIQNATDTGEGSLVFFLMSIVSLRRSSSAHSMREGSRRPETEGRRGWLRGLKLERYEQAFRDNEIDLRVLPELTADDLKELGVAAIGHRRLLLKAIADLAAGAGHAAAEDVPVVPPASSTAEAERRQLTVMFCDLVGSTALSVRFDPEELREEIRAYQNAVSRVVSRYDGFVAKFMGDGVLVYFGYPRAHEDDAERAVRAGLEIPAAVTSLETRGTERLAVRIGIATGLVVVGDLVGEGSAQEQAVVGETPNLAARLQALAEPGQIVLAGATRRLIGDLFRLTDLGRQTAKGFAEPVEAVRCAVPLRASWTLCASG
jgi:class 3 adenylate cyclase